MKDILKEILKYIPAYLNEFISLIGSPKKFIASRNAENIERNFINALAFLGITICLIWFLQAPLIEKDKIFSSFASSIVLTLILVILYSAVLRISWRIVGGKAAFKSFIITHAYYFGVGIFILVIFVMTGNGIIKKFSPELYEILLSGNQQKITSVNLFDDPWFVVGFCVWYLGIVIESIWVFIGWGAYRQLNGLSKWRSFCAFLLVGFFSLPVIAFTYFISQLYN